MRYEKIAKGKFIERENRFVARVSVCGKEEKVHVKNTGRCKELLVPQATVYLEDFAGRMGTRKMRYSLVGVEKQRSEGVLKINMDSQAPNAVVKEALANGKIVLPGMETLTLIKGEQKYGNSRFDFYLEAGDSKGFAEVKGVTLEEGGVAMFPDAPTIRGVKHLKELAKALEEGYNAYVILVIQMKGMHLFKPNYATHPEFGEVLRESCERGVCAVAYDCVVTEDSLTVDAPVKMEF